jgi:hypothetical protein
MTRARGKNIRAALAVALAILAAPGVAAADAASEAEADKHFRHGVELYKENDFATALVEFQRAYEIQPSWAVLYNIGETQFQLQDYAGALKSLQLYLDEGGKKVSPARRKAVEKDIEKLKQRVATLKIGTSEPGAAITVDDAPVGTTPLAQPIVVSAGKRKVTATLGDRPPVSQVVQVASGDVLTVTLEIPPPPAPKVVVARPQPSLATPLVAWAGTAAVTTGAVVTGVLALGASSDLKEKLAAYPADPKAIQSAHNKALALGVTTDVLTAVALAAGGVSIWLTVKHQRAVSDAAAPAPAARLVVYPNGVGIAGTF